MNVRFGISFYSFKNIMRQYNPESSDLELATLFRNSWSAGNGAVNFDSFFLTANESFFFLKQIRVIGFNVIPHLDSFEDFERDDPAQEKFEYIYA